MAALFSSGVVVAAPAALGLLEEYDMNPGELLVRHRSGDWGDVGPEDWRTNDIDLREGGRLLSAYADSVWDMGNTLERGERQCTFA